MEDYGVCEVVYEVNVIIPCGQSCSSYWQYLFILEAKINKKKHNFEHNNGYNSNTL